MLNKEDSLTVRGNRTIKLVVADETGLNIFPSRLGTFPDRARRELTGPVVGMVSLDVTSLSTRDLALASGGAVLYAEDL